MADIAAKTLLTSQGTVKVGGEIPAGLDKDEMVRIRKAGGIAPSSKSDAKSDK